MTVNEQWMADYWNRTQKDANDYQFKMSPGHHTPYHNGLGGSCTPSDGDIRRDALHLALYRPQDGSYDDYGREIPRPIADVLADADAIAAWLGAESVA